MNVSDFTESNEDLKMECNFHDLRRKVEVSVGVTDSKAFIFEKAQNYEYYVTSHGITSVSVENYIIQWWAWLIAVILLPVIIGLVLLITFAILSNRYNIIFMMGEQSSRWGTMSGRSYQVRKKSNDFNSIRNFVAQAF